MAALVKSGRVVLTPYGGHARYDLALDEDGKLHRIQVKTGQLKNGVIRFLTASKATNKEHGGKWQNYRDKVEYFGVYCPQNNKCYLVPVDICPGYEGSLRVDPPLRARECRWAKDFAI